MSMVSVSAPFIAFGVRFYVIYVGPRSSVGVVKGEDVAKKTAEVMVPLLSSFWPSMEVSSVFLRGLGDWYVSFRLRAGAVWCLPCWRMK